MSYVFEVTVVNELHQEQNVNEKLALGVLHDFFSPLGHAMKLVVCGLSFLKRGGLAWEGDTAVQVGQVVFHREHSVAQVEELAQLLELFG